MDMAETLRQFFVTDAGVDDSIDAQTKLFSGGYVDSLTLADLVTFVNETFGVTIPPSGFTVENLDTIESQVRYISSLQAGS